MVASTGRRTGEDSTVALTAVVARPEGGDTSNYKFVNGDWNVRNCFLLPRVLTRPLRRSERRSSAGRSIRSDLSSGTLW
ncbi:hypothetical protein E2C01_077600 [Portunus trituberculatus]|uniref:Uncharacterized protein n=1 Tax=Portunus trituberculatus TaxID=210409 RepID=A0A5B7IBT3_PORTR|nr:hypothetical protein [Portunus trituberculatus]